LNSTYKILIAGAGPAGMATSMILSKNKIKHVLIEKQTFPRDKICGDALSGKVVSELNKIDPHTLKKSLPTQTTIQEVTEFVFFHRVEKC
jgi:flavin-dependent dehydrogenase